MINNKIFQEALKNASLNQTNQALINPTAPKAKVTYPNDVNFKFSSMLPQNKKKGFIGKSIDTLKDAGGRFHSGIGEFFENTIDAAVGLTGAANQFFKDDILKIRDEYGNTIQTPYAKKAQEFVQKDLITTPLELTQNVERKDAYGQSYLQGKVGSKIGQSIQTIGNILPSIAIGNLGGSMLGQASFFANAAGGGIQEALNEGANLKQAGAYGTLSGLVELGTEKMFGLVGGQFLGKTADTAIDTLIRRKITSSLGRTLTKVGVGALGEGIEEATSEIINPFLKNLTYSEGEKVDMDAVVDSAISGALTSLFFGGYQVSSKQAQIGGALNEYSSAQQKQEQALLKGDAQTQKKYKAVIDDINKEVSSKLKKMDAQTRKDTLSKINEMGIDWFNADGSFNEKNFTVNQNIASKLVGETANVNANFDVSQATEEVKTKVAQATALYKKIKDKTSNAPGLMFDNTLEGNINGYFNPNTNEIVINPNTNVVVETLKHEFTHSLSGTEIYATMLDYVVKDLQASKEYATIRSEIIDLYNDKLEGLTEKQLDQYVNEEIVSQYAERLFTNEKSIDKLVKENKTLAQKVFDWIGEKLKNFTGKLSKEDSTNKKALEKIEDLWVKALEERETSNKEVKYSLNSQGKELTKEQQEFFKDSTVRDENGNLLVVYHGTAYAGFTKFKGDIYLTTSKEIAGDYAGNDIDFDPNNPQADREAVLGVDKKPLYIKNIKDVYNNLKKYTVNNFIDIADSLDQNNSVRDSVMEGATKEDLYEEMREWLEEKIEDNSNASLYVGKLPSENIADLTPYTVNQKIYSVYANIINPFIIDKSGGKVLFKDIKEAKAKGHDGVIASNTSEGRGNKRGTTVVAFNSNQVKSTDNLNPTKSDDIRYSIAGKNLVAIHNLNEENLTKTINLGGFPMPSIAITKQDLPYEYFGDISIIFDKNSIDPAYNINKVYSGDAWTPVVPSTVYKIDDDAVRSTSKKLRSAFDEVDYNYLRFEQAFDNNSINEATRILSKHSGMKNAFAKEKGIEIKTPYKTRETQTVLPVRFVEEFANKHPEVQTMHDVNEIGNLMDAFEQEIIEMRLRYFKEEFGATIEAKTSYGEIDSFLTDVVYYRRGLFDKKVTDTRKMEDKLNEAISDDNSEYLTWIREIISPFYQGEYIRKTNVDPYKRDGSRKTFNQLNVEKTLGNIVSEMLKQDSQGNASLTNSHSIIAGNTKQYNSIEEIRKEQDYIVDETTYNETVEKYSDILFDLRTDLYNKYYKRKPLEDVQQWIAQDSVSNMIADIGKSSKTDSKIKSIFDKYGMATPSAATIKELQELFNGMKNLVVKYFEAKPQRAVGLDEIKLVLLPENTGDKLINLLEKNNIPYEKYTSDKSRQDIIKANDDLRFSLNDRSLPESAVEAQSLSENFKKSIDNMQYEVQSNKTTLERAKQNLGDYTDPKVLQEKSITFIDNVEGGNLKGAVSLTEGQLLLIEASRQENYELANDLLVSISIYATDIGQQVQALSLISKLTPEGKLMALERTVNRMNRKEKKISHKKFGEVVVIRKQKYYEIEKNSIINQALVSTINTLREQAGVSKTQMTLLEKELSAALKRSVVDFDKLTPYQQNAIKSRIKLILDKYKARNSQTLANAIDKQFYTEFSRKNAMLLKKLEKDNIFIPTDIKKKFLEAKTEEERTQILDDMHQIIADQMPATTFEKLRNWRYLSMLANPKTHLRNIGANIIMRQVDKVKNTIARALEEKIIKGSGNRTRTFKKPTKEIVSFAQEDANTVLNTQSLSGEKYSSKDSIQSKRTIFRTRFIEKARKFNFSMLELEDMIFGLKPVYVKTLSEYITAKKLDPNTMTEQQLNDARLFAIEEAQRVTFRSSSAFASWLNKQKAKNIINEILLDAVAPFTTTPINILKTGVAYSPIGLAKTLMHNTKQLKKGDITINKYIDNISQGLTGTGVMVLGYFMAMMGLIGSGDEDDRKLDSYQKGLGKQDFSLQIGDVSFTLDWLSPSAMPLFSGVKLYEAIQSNDENILLQIPEMMLYTFDPLTEMSLLRGFNQVLSSYSDNKLQGIISNALGSYAGQFIPTIFNQVARTIDDTRRQTTATNDNLLGNKQLATWFNKQINRIPFLSMALEPYTDVWGNEVKDKGIFNMGAIGRLVENGALPFWVERNVATDVDKEIISLYQINGNSDIIPKIASNNFTMNKIKYELDAKEYTTYKKIIGKQSYNSLQSLFASDEYKQATPEEKESMIARIYRKSQIVAKDMYMISNLERGIFSNKATANKIIEIISNHENSMLTSKAIRESDLTQAEQDLVMAYLNIANTSSKLRVSKMINNIEDETLKATLKQLLKVN